jgi:hypothetical protein
MLDCDTVNQENTIEYRMRLEENKTKNHILSMHDTQKKQTLWRKHFPVAQITNDDWMLNAKVW